MGSGGGMGGKEVLLCDLLYLLLLTRHCSSLVATIAVPKCSAVALTPPPLQLHSRTHTDGESLWSGQHETAGNSVLDEVADAVAVVAGPVVFVGPMEHHSNILPWRESAGARENPLLPPSHSQSSTPRFIHLPPFLLPLPRSVFTPNPLLPT